MAALRPLRSCRPFGPATQNEAKHSWDDVFVTSPTRTKPRSHCPLRDPACVGGLNRPV